MNTFFLQTVSVLILDEWCFVINLGDSRGLYSFNSGKRLYQITRDHKPNDPIEKERIEKAGGKIYKDDEVIFRGEKMKIDEKNLPPGVILPYRVIPGNISVRKIYFFIILILISLQVTRTIGDFQAKEESFGGKANTIICLPCTNSFQINEKSDFILLGCK